MILQKLVIYNFKNHAELTFEPDVKWNCITGLNGTGKTNLLEAIYFLCILKGFGSRLESNNVKHGEQFFRLDGLLTIQDNKFNVILKYPIGGKKEVLRNNKRIKRMSEHIGQFPVLLVQPIDDYRILEGSHARRRLLDHSLAQSFKEYLKALSVYAKLLKQRNAMLKNVKGGMRLDPHLYGFYSGSMSEPAETIMSYRDKLIGSIRADMERLYTSISSGRETPFIGYKPDLIEKTLKEQFEVNKELDHLTGRTNAGPHKDDLILTLDDIPLKDGSSQGQRKSFLLAFKLAVYLFIGRYSGQAPVLLLDDLFDKLDNQRVSNLLKVLNEPEFGQVFITDKDHNHLLGIMSELKYNFKHLYLK